MANTILVRRGLEANRASFTPLEGEAIYTTDTKILYIGDGVTAGGNRVTFQGDMNKSTYDTDASGVVDNSELLNGEAGSFYLDRTNHTGTQTLSTISDAGTSASKDVGILSGNVPELDGNGKLNTSILPALAITSISTVANETEQLALVAEEGDIAIRTDLSVTYAHNGGTAGTMADWTELSTPTDAVSSVNGKTGVVTLTTTDIGEGTNLYHTVARAIEAIGADLDDASSANNKLWSAEKIISYVDSSTVDGGTF